MTLTPREDGPLRPLHRSRELLVRQRTMLANAIGAHFAEFGIVAAQGIGRIGELAALLVG